MRFADPVRTECRLITGLCLLLLTTSGCGKAESTGIVSGTVSLGGSPLAAGDIILREEVSGEGATASVKEGAFRFDKPVKTGNYKVFVQPPPPPPPLQASPGSSPRVAIPDRYLFTSVSSPLKAKVVEGENTFDFALEK